ncbi:hypothetical protein KC906_01870 [Candidatus Kaiserbacteria bacterium]|nr:hypothetical protein [Candidatus Kaiserbacteria bacterium]MCB9812047.1 hypothetical protein [Candidatus Nomurabacteria bacterium]
MVRGSQVLFKQIFIVALIAPVLVRAQIPTQPFAAPLRLVLENILLFINETLIPFIIGLGFVFFVWGVVRYFVFGGADEESRAKGRSLAVYATLGFVAMIIFWGVVNMIVSSIGGGGETLENIPRIPEL